MKTREYYAGLRSGKPPGYSHTNLNREEALNIRWRTEYSFKCPKGVTLRKYLNQQRHLLWNSELIFTWYLEDEGMKSEGQRKGWRLVRLIRSVIGNRTRTYSCIFACVRVNLWLYYRNLTHHSRAQNLQGSILSSGKHPPSFFGLPRGELLFVSHDLAPADLSTSSPAACPSWLLLLQTHWTCSSSSHPPNSHQLFPQRRTSLPPSVHWLALFMRNFSALRSLLSY